MDADGLSVLNPAPVKLPGPGLLHHLVTPPCDLAAIRHRSQGRTSSYSYRDLHQAADGIASLITCSRRHAGRSGPDFVVPLLVPQSPLLCISLLAILKAGGAFCPLNIDAPSERIKFILKDVSAEVLLVSSALASRIPPVTGVNLVIVDRFDETVSHDDVGHRQPTGADLAYVMYTSGSTGLPKGVGVSHAAATQALLAHDRHIPAFSRFLQFAAPTFDVSVFEIFFPLFRGSTLITVRRDEMLNDLPSVLRDMDVDACELTPTVAGSLLRSRNNAPKLKLLLTIGEMLNAPVVQEFGGEKWRESMLWAMYGPTEATIHCTLQTALPSESSTGNIGIPLDTVSCFVIEPSSDPNSFKLLPIGQVGELAVGGHQLARGYLNRPEQTASAFIPSPYGRVYRTGDRARLTAAGTLECLGRLANGQVKLRGQRIELGEIEQVVLRTPGCHGAVAAVVHSILVVFCAVDGHATEEAIVANCRKWLPQFMVPGEVVMMHDFPRLPSGKTDTERMKSHFSERRLVDLNDDDILPHEASLEEDEVLDVVSETLGLKAFRRMTLASAGVDSLAAIKLASALRLSGYETSAAQLLKGRTMSDLCCALSKRHAVGSIELEPLNISLLSELDQILAQTPELQDMAAHIEDVFPCIPLQSALLAETARDSQLYCNEIELQTTAGLAPSDVAAAIHQVLRDNEVLRTGFIHWRGAYLAVLFKSSSTDNVQIVPTLQHGFICSTPRDFLTPFRVQIRASENGSRPWLLIQAHHAVYDGWTMDMIRLDVSTLLNGAPLPRRPQFREVLRYHTRGSRKEEDDLARKFWSEHLLGWNKTPLPKLAARPLLNNEIKTTKDTLKIPPGIVLQTAQNGPVFVSQVLFQASLALAWSGVVGESDVVFGSVTSGRTMPVGGIDKIMGPCIASLPLRVDFSSMLSNMDALRNIQASNRAIMEHCMLPLSEIKKLAGLRPAESLYDILFVYQQSLDTPADETKDLFSEVDHLDRLETKLLLEVQPHNWGYALHATYHCSEFPKEFVECFLQQFKHIFWKLRDHPEAALQPTRSFVTSSLSIYNGNPQVFHGTPDLAIEFEATAAKSPSATALCFTMNLTTMHHRTMTLSYQQLNRAANQTAQYLRSYDVEVGEVLAIVMDKSPILYTSILGIIKAGCAYLPILPTTPLVRVCEIFKQARIKHCLVDSTSLRALALVEDVQLLDMETASLQSLSKENAGVPPDPSRLAYVIYTSGTTGVPKGVAVTQGNIVSNIAHLRSLYPASLTEQPRFLQACSQAFDVSVFEIFFAWQAGMCLCAATNDDLFQDLEISIRELRITHLSLTPTVASLIDPTQVPEVEFLVTAGEPMTKSVLDRWGDKLWQGYGPSETTNICSVKRMTRGDNIEHLGWVFSNTSASVLSPYSLEAVPIGWAGELCFGGDQVAQGYLNNPRLTSEKFVRHPTLGRIYRSGDMGRMLPDGSMIVLGRLDDQIKLRGQRIEAGEINSMVTSTALATSSVTISVQRRNGAPEQLASFYVPPEAKAEFRPLKIAPEANSMLFASLQSRVPSYMVPSYLIPVSQIPLTSSGKVDRRRLQASFRELPKNYVEEASCTTQRLEDDAGWEGSESTIADVIASSVNVSKADIGRWTPFAALGVDSIFAIDVARTLSSRLKARVPISAILENPCIAQLARYLEKGSNGHTENGHQLFDMIVAGLTDEVRSAFGHDSDAIEEILPCTPLQEAMLSRGSGYYYNKILLRLRIRAEDMRSYWNEMSQRHGILRTCFVTTRNPAHPIAQVVLSKRWRMAWRSFEVHMPSLAAADHEHLKCLPEPLDSRMPPLSCAFIRYKGSTFFSLICHHALYDGVAMENLWREVEALAHGGSLPPPLPYKPFIQKALNLPEDTDAFWADHFREFHPSNLFPRLVGADINQCTHTTSFDATFVDVQEQLRSLAVPLLSACQAAWANVVAVACDCLDIAFGNVVSGRTMDLDGIDRLVAPCFNTIPMRNDLSRSLQNIDVVRGFQQLGAKMMRHQFTPLRRVHKAVKCPHRGLFDTLLVLQQPLHEMDESVWTLEEDSGNMDLPLVCEVVPCPNLNSIVVNIHYDIDIISVEVATLVADIFKYMLRRLTDFPFASPADRSSLPPSLQLGLNDLVPRRERREEGDRKPLDNEVWTDTETVIREIMSELSGARTASIRRQTSIFQLGLDSINAVQVASMLRQKGFQTSAADVIECPSCAKLADRILRTAASDVAAMPLKYDLQNFCRDVSTQISRKAPLVDSHIEAVLPSTPVQCAMLVLFIQSNGRNYLNMLTYEIDDGVTAVDIVDAWASLQRRHPMLRTGFVPVDHRDSAFAMVRQSAAAISAPVECVDGASCRDFDAQRWREEARDSILRCLHLPPWKVAVVDTGRRRLMHVIIHHAIYDAQSLNGMMYGVSCLLRGQEPSFPAVEPALAELLSLSLTGQESAQGFWEKQADNVVVNKFPIMTPLREETVRLLTHERVSSMSLGFLREGAQSLGASIRGVVQAAWARVLASYLGESSVVFGVILSGRTTDETQATPFPCITTVPVVASTVESNRELVLDMMEHDTDLHKYQFAPLSLIQKWLGRPATPVFDTIVVYQKRRRDEITKSPWNLVEDDAVVEYAVSIEVEPTDDDQVCLRIAFAADILPREQASLLLRQFDATLNHLVREPTGKQHELYKEHPDIFSITPAADADMAAPVRLLHEFVESRAATHPGSTALEFVSGMDNKGTIRKQSWNYKDLDLMGNRVASLIREHTRVGDIVAIHFHKCPEAYFSILGILKAGCAFVALDPTAPSARKEFILRDSQATCLVTDGDSGLDFQVGTKMLRIDDKSLQGYPDRRPDVSDDGGGVKPANTCYCLYTSGTTGTPKGCEISHENAVQAMMAFQELFRGHWEADSRWLQFAALHFDVSVLEQYWSWSVGIIVVAAPRELILDDLAGFVNRLGITHIDLTPSLARLTHPAEMPSLCRGVFITGGEQLKQEILDNWGSKAVVYNAYGPTEATIGVTMYQRVPVNGRPSNIGKQFPNVGSYIFLPGTEMPVLRGAVGELCVSGKLVGKGYLNRPELTAERFPTLAESGERVYRTGDLVRILHDGCFDFLGRADDQVKLRGQRLETGEINHAIRTGAPEIVDAATIVVRNELSGKDLLVSFLVGQSGGSQSFSTLPDVDGLGPKARAACLQRLPPYMVPTYFLRLTHMPLSPNNKVEAKKLKALFTSLSHEQLMALSAADKPGEHVRLDKHVLATVMRAVSDFGHVPHESLSPSTSVFDAGVDSITALRLSTLLRKQGLQAASPAVLLRFPVLADLVRALSVDAAAVQQADVVREGRQTIQACHHRYRPLVCRELGVGPGDIAYIAPCSPLQQGIISRTMADETRSAYFTSLELQLDEGASGERVRQAWSGLIASHAVLRSVFVNTADGYIQSALKRAETPWRVYAVEAKDEVGTVLEATRRAWVAGNNHHILHPFQLVHVHGPGFQSVILHIFHALYDGTSLELMSRSAAALYHDKQPRPGTPFIEALAHGPLSRHDHCRPFWTEYLRDWQYAPLPALPREQDESSGAVSATRSVSLGPFEQLRTRQNVTLQSAVLAVWASVLQRHLGSRLTVGVIVAGRSIDLAGVEHTVGPLFNTVPFFSKTLQGHTWTSLVRAVHQFSTSVLDFQHVPLQNVQKWCSGGRPLFDNLFALQLEQPGADGEGAPWTIVDGASYPDHALALEATRTLSGHLRLSLVAQSRFADASTLEGMLDQVEHMVVAAQAGALVDPSPGDEKDVRSATVADSTTLADTNDNLAGFDWTEQALLVREEVAVLANVPVEQVTATRTMLELGLDSIDVLKLSTRLKQRGAFLSASQIMRHQTVSRMTQAMETAQEGQMPNTSNEDLVGQIRSRLRAQVERAGLSMDNVESVLAPTALQESMVAGMLQSEFEWYFNHDVLEVARGVDMERLRKAWVQLIEQSPVLRTGFVPVDDAALDMAYCQVVLRREAPHMMTTAALSDMSDMRQVMRDATQMAAKGAGVDHLVQVAFATLGERRFVVLSMAHALYDGWSLGLMYQDLEAAYEGRPCRRPAADEFVSRALASQTAEAQAFWASHLDGLVPTILSGSGGQTEAAPGSVRRREVVSSSTLRLAMAYCRKRAVSLQVLCAACWAMVAAAQTRSLDVVFGVVLSGRDAEGAEGLMFPTMNTVAMRCVLHGSVSGFLQYLQQLTADVSGFQAFPLRKARAAARLAATSAMFDSLFLVQRAPKDGAGAGKLLRSVDGSSMVDYPVCVEAEPVGDGLTWRIACQARLFSDEETDALIRRLDRVLQFVLQPETADANVLAFHGEDVSICGLPAVTIKEAQPADRRQPLAGPPEGEAQWSDEAAAVRDVLAQLSGAAVESIKPSSTLYHLGLDSISAIKASMLLRKRGIHLRPRELVASTNLVETARQARVEAGEREQPALETPPAAWTPPPHVDTPSLLQESGLWADCVEAVLPATAMQVYMLTAWQNARGAVFFPEFRYRVDAAVDGARVHEAWQTLTSQTPMLRTRFVATGSTQLPWLQVVVTDEAMRSGRVSQPLTRFSAAAAAADDGDQALLLRLAIHHALYDGVSLPAMTSRLSGLLSGEAAERAPSMTPWARYSVHPTLPHVRSRRQEFWTQYLQHSSWTSPWSTSRLDAGDRVSYLDPSAMSDVTRLRGVASRHGISLQALVLAALAKTLAAQPSSGDRCVVLGLYLANRSAEPDAPPPDFPTLSLVPLRVNLAHGNGGVVAVAEAVQHDMHRITSDGRADVGLWEVMAWTGLTVDCWVNFLRIPMPDAPEPPRRRAARSMLTPVPVHDDAAAADGPSARVDAPWREPAWLRRNAVRDAFPVGCPPHRDAADEADAQGPTQASVDVEVAVQGRALAVGVFGPGGRVSAAWAAETVADVVAVLDAASA